MATLHNPRTRFVVGGPALVDIKDDRTCQMAVINTAPFDIQLERDDFIGAIEALPTTPVRPIDALPVASIVQPSRTPAFSKQQLQASILAQTEPDFREDLFNLLHQHRSILARGPPGPKMQDPRRLHLTEPLYQKQGKILLAHRPLIEETLDSWSRLGLVRKADSMFNTPLFCLQHPNGYRIVQDFQALNWKDHPEPIKFKKVHETLQDVEVSKPKIFSTLDFSDLVWQMDLSEEQAAHTAFTIPGQGQFQWNQTPLGLMGAQAAFQRLLESLFGHLKGLLVHIDRIIVYHRHWEDHKDTLRQVFQIMQNNKLQINTYRSSLATDSANVLGFHIAQGQVHMAPSQLGTAEQWPAPTDTQMIRSFLGLCNFFRAHICDYAAISEPLNRLLRKETSYKGGPLPDDAMEAFIRL